MLTASSKALNRAEFQADDDDSCQSTASSFVYKLLPTEESELLQQLHQHKYNNLNRNKSNQNQQLCDFTLLPRLSNDTYVSKAECQTFQHQKAFHIASEEMLQKNYLLTNYDDSGLFSSLKLIKHWAISEYVRN
ncbi:hypothetical protein T01_1972 [Trichinella spiralis]|uniref:Uncharacterized protein n=1 Tax=Trichinella spiralis TaxID=6334 RepID=A0A0V1BUS2_TRISP|nr:hypothetical protein T01_1972 [Trichinella spiralis]